MPFIGELPGHYYDAEKDKYFKIEADHRATPSVKYTTGSVKRIANECHDARVDEKVKRIRREGTVRRALPPGDPAGALLRREMGAYVDGAEADVAAGLWASGLERKGVLRGTWGGEIVDMFVGGEKDTGLATVFHVADGDAVMASYFPPDVDDERDVSRGMRATQYQGVDFRPSLVAPEAGFTAMAYDKRSDSMLFVGQILDEQVMPRTQVMARTIPARDPALLRQPSPHAPRRPTWDHLDLPSRNRTDALLRRPMTSIYFPECTANICIATPASAYTAFLVGTTRGILQRDRSAVPSLSWLQAPVKTKTRAAKAVRKEILALDLLPSNSTRVLLAGGRGGQLCMVDLRAPDGEWVSFDLTSPIAHIKAIDEHHVLAAGPKNAMAVYDTRYTRKPPGIGGRDNSTVPVLTFPEYKNASDIHLGLDVLLGPGYGSGLVAAAHDDGKVALFSLRDGRKLACPALDGVNLARPPLTSGSEHFQRNTGPDYLLSNAVVRKLMFTTLPEDQHASLFVAGKLGVEKFSFSRRREEWM